MRKPVSELVVGDWIIGTGGSRLLVRSVRTGLDRFIIETDIGPVSFDDQKMVEVAEGPHQPVWVMFHTYEHGHQIEIYDSLAEAQEHAAEIALAYGDDDDNHPDEGVRAAACAAFERGDYDAVLKAVSVAELDDRCNLEVFESHVQGKK